MTAYSFRALLGGWLLFSSVALIAGARSDSLIVYGPTGAVIASVSIDESSESPTAIYVLNFAGTNPNLTKATTLIEPDGSFSDIFGIVGINGRRSLAFNSDSNTAPAVFGGQGQIFLPEGGGSFDASLYLDPALVALGYTAVFQSDVIPEPGSLILFGTGLLAVSIALRRRMS